MVMAFATGLISAAVVSGITGFATSTLAGLRAREDRGEQNPAEPH